MVYDGKGPVGTATVWILADKLDLENNDLPRNEAGDLLVTDSVTFNETWVEVEKILASGKARAIGVSNFSIKT